MYCNRAVIGSSACTFEPSIPDCKAQPGAEPIGRGSHFAIVIQGRWPEWITWITSNLSDPALRITNKNRDPVMSQMKPTSPGTCMRRRNAGRSEPTIATARAAGRVEPDLEARANQEVIAAIALRSQRARASVIEGSQDDQRDHT